jgi:hypothetical protein
MTDESSNGSVLFTESPASWNTLYLSPEGYVCQLTLRADTGAELLEKAKHAMAHLQQHGCKPYGSPRVKADGKNNESVDRDDAAWCPIHECEMKRWEKDGRTWYSRKINGEWCRGK